MSKPSASQIHSAPSFERSEALSPTGESGERGRRGESLFSLTMKVRDYECDLQGIVNNANYLHYTEHTRHEFLRAHNISFADLHERGIDAVVARINMQFKTPLRSGDEFCCTLNVRQEGVKYIFEQNILRLPKGEVVNRSEITTVCLVNGRLKTVPELDALVKTAAP